MKKKFLLLISILVFCKVFCQESDVSHNIKFANYLTNKKLYKESIFVLESQKKVPLNSILKDSLFYLIGNNFFSLHQYQQSNSNYLLVGESNSILSTTTLFKTANNYLHLKKYDSANWQFEQIKDTLLDTKLAELKYFCLASNALLIRDTANYSFYNSKMNSESDLFLLATKHNNLAYRKIINHKNKSPLLAGILSAIIPGSGKFYAGKKGQAIGAFVPIATLGILALEAYNNGGAKSIPFWGFSTLFSVFYISNIWGSTMSVKIAKAEFNNTINNEIIINMQLPINDLLR